MYEDENTNYNYEKGKFIRIPLSYQESSKTLTIGQQQGAFEGMLKNRTFNIVYVSQNKPKQLQFDVRPDQVVKYTGKAVSVRLK